MKKRNNLILNLTLAVLALILCLCLGGCNGTDATTQLESTPAASPDTPSESSVTGGSVSSETNPSFPDAPKPPVSESKEFTYDFTNDINGSAAGVINYLTEHTGTFYAYWDSEAPKDSKWGTPGELFYKYEPFATGYAAKGETLTLSVHEWTAIPDGATRVLICHGYYKDTVYVYDLPKEKVLDRGEPVYTFGSISDVHIGNRYGSFETSVNAFTNALELLAKHNVSLVAISGDITVTGSSMEYGKYKQIVDTFCESHPNINVYSTTGNHDIPGIFSYWPTSGVGSDNYTGQLEVKRYGDNKYDYTVSVGDDVFVFLTQQTAYYNNPMLRNITKEQMEWLRQRFEENKDKTVYLYFHTFLDNENGDASNGYYEYDLPFCKGAPDDVELRALLREYKNVIMFTGHSHWVLSMQDAFDADEGQYNHNANIADGNGEYGVLVHNPSVSEPRALTGTNSSRDELHGKASEGYVVYVYDDCLILYGYDFQNDKLMAKYSYIIDTSERKAVTAGELDNTVWELSSEDSSAALIIDDMTAYLFLAKNGKTQLYCGGFSVSEDGSAIIIDGLEFPITVSAVGGSLGITVNGVRYKLIKNAAASASIK